jgi:tetratricopeptide (TPR) repeat protein
MQKTCPSCGADIFPGARFCRRCGAPSREDSLTGDVSPRAETVPLQEVEGRVTEALAPEDGRPSADTTRVSLSEMEKILRSRQDGSPNPANTPPSYSTHSAVTRPDAPAARDEEVTITVPRHAAPATRDSAALDPNALDLTALDFEKTADAGARRDLDAARDSHVTVPRDARDDDELTVVAAGPPPAHSNAAVEDSNANASDANANGSGAHAVVRPNAQTRKRRWPVVVGLCVAALLAAALTLVAYTLLRRQAMPDYSAEPKPALPPVTPRMFDEKLAEAEALLAQGDMEGAKQRLREANSMDGANWRAHYRLGELLIASGARREGIDELRIAAHRDPDDLNVWRELAAALFAEGLYREAAEWYGRLVAVRRDAADPSDLIAYADSLRLSGRPEEARPIYQRVASGATGDLADTARQRLAELAQSQPAPSPTPRAGEQTNARRPGENETASVTQPGAQPTPQPTPTPAPAPTAQPTPARPAPASPEEHYRHGQMLWSSDRGAALEEFRSAAAGGNYDAHYYLGLSYVEGRSLHSLKRAEVVAALQHFQLAQRGRQFVAEARRYQQQLEKEFDRLRGQ